MTHNDATAKNQTNPQEIGLLVQKRVIASAQTLLRLIGPDVLHCAPLRHPMLARNGPKSLQQVLLSGHKL